MKKRGVLSGIIKLVVVACLVVAIHQARAQERPIATETPVKVARVVPTSSSKMIPAGSSKMVPTSSSKMVPTCFSAHKVHLTGSAALAGGSVDVKFKESLSKSASSIKVIVTPVGSWSGIYVINMSLDGFTAKSGVGDPKARFNWIVVRE